MTRKLLSGVLAFAMVFGCTAPVALAEDTTVEEVEQYTVYAPSLSKDTVELLHEGDSATVTVNDVADDATVSIDTEYEDDFSVTLKDGKLTITAKKDVVAAETKLQLHFLSYDANGMPDDYMGVVKLTVK